MRSCSEWNGEAAGTAMTSYSPVSRAIGVTSASVTGERLRHDAAEHDQAGDHHRVAVAALGADEAREADRARRARNVLDRSEACDDPARCSTCCMARAVWSQPPPGAAGAMMRSWSWRAGRQTWRGGQWPERRWRARADASATAFYLALMDWLSWVNRNDGQPGRGREACHPHDKLDLPNGEPDPTGHAVWPSGAITSTCACGRCCGLAKAGHYYSTSGLSNRSTPYG